MPGKTQRRGRANGSTRTIGGVAAMNAYIKAIADIMRRSGRAGALQYVPELTWMLFLRILDERERREIDEAAALGLRRTTTLDPPYRWFDWAAPYDPTITDAEDRVQGWKRRELQAEAVGAITILALLTTAMRQAVEQCWRRLPDAETAGAAK
ncbi:MAG: hypothetical protein OHK0015_53810 [Chloroflexi bacterium OHK40]